jgi:hypothetical protein
MSSSLLPKLSLHSRYSPMFVPLFVFRIHILLKLEKIF